MNNIEELERQYTYRSIAEGTLSEKEFKYIWEQCMSGSGNQTSILTIDEHFYSVQTELGKGWEKSCIVFYDKNELIGMSIPHIETGTESEGRLFLFWGNALLSWERNCFPAASSIFTYVKGNRGYLLHRKRTYFK